MVSSFDIFKSFLCALLVIVVPARTGLASSTLLQSCQDSAGFQERLIWNKPKTWQTGFQWWEDLLALMSKPKAAFWKAISRALNSRPSQHLLLRHVKISYKYVKNKKKIFLSSSIVHGWLLRNSGEYKLWQIWHQRDDNKLVYFKKWLGA